MRSSMKTFSALAAVILGSAGLVAGPAALSAAAAGPVLVPLSQAFDNVGITAPADSAPGNLDGTGDSLSATGLASDGLSPGAPVLHDGVTLRWPDVAPGGPDNVVADGQVIELGAHRAGVAYGSLDCAQQPIGKRGERADVWQPFARQYLNLITALTRNFSDMNWITEYPDRNGLLDECSTHQFALNPREKNITSRQDKRETRRRPCEEP